MTTAAPTSKRFIFSTDCKMMALTFFIANRSRSANELDLVNQTVQEFFSKNAHSDYVVSDCDIDIGVADPRVLILFRELLNLFPDVQCVGPMLRICDVSPTYPLYNQMMNRHIEQFWRHRPSWVQTEAAGRIAYLRSAIDTTFAMHRKREAFRRLKTGLRVYEPLMRSISTGIWNRETWTLIPRHPTRTSHIGTMRRNSKKTPMFR